jgi:hypothetical protein
MVIYDVQHPALPLYPVLVHPAIKPAIPQRNPRKNHSHSHAMPDIMRIIERKNPGLQGLPPAAATNSLPTDSLSHSSFSGHGEWELAVHEWQH